MHNLIGFAVVFILAVVTLAICWRERVWREAWRNPAGRSILVATCATLAAARCLSGPSSWILHALMDFPFLLLLLTPLVSASVWFGATSSWPIEGLRPGAGWRGLFECAAVMAGCLLVTLIFQKLFGWRLRDGIPDSMKPPAGDSVLMPWTICIFFGLAAVEEVVFRGVLLRWLRWEARKWKHATALAMVVSSVAFAAGHELSWLKVGQSTLMGIGLAWISVRHGLWAAIGSHWALNLAVIALIGRA